MNASRLSSVLGVILAITLIPTSLYGQPLLSVTNTGANADGNNQWQVDIAPDVALFSETSSGLGGSLSTEIGFSIEGSTFLSAVANQTDWPWQNPGNNPFTSNVTNGVNVHYENAFVSLGSNVFTSGDSVPLVTFVTSGTSASTLTWGGQTLLPRTSTEFIGGRIAQGGLNFDSYTGSLNSASVVLPLDCNSDGNVDREDIGCATSESIEATLSQAGFLPGDFDLDGTVAFADFLTLSGNFGKDQVGFAGGDADVDGTVAFADFLMLSGNFGASFEAAAVVPEPSSFVMALIAPLTLLAVRKKSITT